MNRGNMTRPWLPCQRVCSIATAALIGLVVFDRAVGLQVLDPQNIDWIFNSGIDPSFHFVGWHMFRFDNWRLPLGAVTTLGYPIGTSVALTDSIPLVAIPLKIASTWLPSRFQYLGGWLFACYVLQAVFGALLVGTLTRRTFPMLLAAAIFSLSPLVVHRMTHEALTAHWLILAALWLYFARDWTRGHAPLVGWLTLVVIASATHPYMAAMVMAVAFAAAVRQMLDAGFGWQSLLRLTATLTALLSLTGFVWWVCGYFIVRDQRDLQQTGFGDLSLNLAAPLISTAGTLLHGRLPLTMTISHYEGYAYLGLGTAALLLIAMPLSRPTWSSTALRTLGPLWLVCIGLTVLALSPRITFGMKTLIEYDAAWWGPLSFFRASGRLFWLPYYVIVFGAIAVVIKRLSSRGAVLVLVGAVALQAADMRGVYRLSKAARMSAMEEHLRSDFWKVVPRFYRHMTLIPTNMCTFSSQRALDYRFFALEAGPAGATLNAGFAARYDVNRVVRYCQTFADERRQGVVSDEELYVLFADLVPAFQAGAQRPVTCAVVDGYGTCFTALSHQAWRDRINVVQ